MKETTKTVALIHHNGKEFLRINRVMYGNEVVKYVLLTDGGEGWNRVWTAHDAYLMGKEWCRLRKRGLM